MFFRNELHNLLKTLGKLFFYVLIFLYNVATGPKFSGTLRETKQVLVATTKLLLNSKEVQCYVTGVCLQVPFLCSLTAST
jgi:hypothetical protein